LPCVPSNRPVPRQQRRKAAARTARAGVVPAELLEEFGVDADDAVATLDAGLARGNPRRRLLKGSKGYFSVLVTVHDVLPGAMEQEDHSQHGVAAAKDFLRERGTRQMSTFLRKRLVKCCTRHPRNVVG
jgi:hypothetical protein